ncbi:hypothetical protein HS088_TW12G00523 [Tripterygium wilfordii]|uniref:Syringolide-induced protein 14-1-1 n=1 Tax=Tripterygium wilfordii TaxID=458696 RepID=A0A7J7CZC3_TRIWF|nr:uncharacterized protein At1g76070-like [Tripterygium wilfordii]KAF5739319.1 hypothetical protein HS088_TW12G00523 [Tripterygium wilfordii]
MENKQARGHKNNILKLLPRAASAVNFYNPIPFSPGRDHKIRHSDNIHKLRTRGFSGPIASIIPAEARRKLRSDDFYEAQEEPTSPKISCMGQIKQYKHKKMTKNDKKITKPREDMKSTLFSPKVQASKIKRIFVGRTKPPRKSEKLDRAPSLSKMKQFASGRNHRSIADFDWTAQIAPEESGDGDYYSDEEGEEEEVVIPFSAPIAVVGGVALQPKKEINLWKKRNMNPPRPLQLNSRIRAN